MTTTKPTASWGAFLFGLNSLRLLALCGGVALYAININVVNTLLPTLVKDIGGLELYSWATSLFVAASILSVALSTSLLHVFGLRAAFLLAILVFTLGSICTAFSTNIYFLLGARSLQGVGGGLLLGLSYTAIRLVFSAPLWLRATALISSMWGVAALAGPAVGGIFAQSGHWRLAFIAPLPIAVVVAFLVMLSLKPREENQAQPLPYIPIFKAALLSWSVIVIAFGSLSASLLLMALSVVIVFTILYGIARDDENHPQTALFPTGSYTFSQPLGSLYASIAVVSMVMGIGVFAPYFLEEIHGMSPLWAGYMTALIPAGWALGALSTVRMTSASTGKYFIIGPLFSALSLVALGVLLPWQALSARLDLIWTLTIPLFGVGLGLGVVWPHLIIRIFHFAPSGQENTATAAMITWQLYALSVGVAVAGMITTEVGLDIGLAYTQLSARLLFMMYALLPVLFVFVSRAARLSFKEP